MVSLSNHTSAKSVPIPSTNGDEEQKARGGDLGYRRAAPTAKAKRRLTVATQRRRVEICLW